MSLEESDRVSLRAYVDHRIDALDRLLRQQLIDMEQARTIQAREYERRLDALNGEQARLAADRERFVSRELYEQAFHEWRLWRDAVNAQLAGYQGRERGLSALWVAGIGAASVALALLALLLR